MANCFWGHSLNNKQPIRNHNKIVDLLPATVWALWHATCKSCLLLEPGERPPSEKMIIMCCGKDGMTLFACYNYIIRHITIIYISMHHYASKYILLDWTINYLNVWLTKLLLHSISSLCHFIRYIYITVCHGFQNWIWQFLIKFESCRLHRMTWNYHVIWGTCSKLLWNSYTRSI